MGFFSWLGRTVGKGLEWVGEKTGIWAIEKAGMDLQDACSKTSRDTGSTREYDQYTATVDETANMAEILSGFSSGLREQGNTIEQSAKKCVGEYFDQLYAALDATLGQEQAIKNLKVQKQLVIQTIDGSFNDILARRVSLSDSECLDILKMSKGAAKEAKMKSFGEKVIREGLDKLCKNVRKSVAEICDGIDSELGSMVAQQQKLMEEFSRKLEEISNNRKTDMYAQEDDMFAPAQKLAASEIILDLVQEV
jgi:hypothetical protein